MTAADRVRAAYAAIAAADRPEIWITLRPMADALADAEAVDNSAATLPLAGLVAAVKNNIDVAGILTTAACPGFSTTPAATDATAVSRMRAAGAVIIGTTNLDQFATGLVGTRSPYGAVRDARRPEYISGGSSSGSAVAVALGLVDIALGTDTAGSGRVPAALQGIVGIKPTLGVVPTDGVVPACRSYDCVTVFARDLDTADTAMGVLGGGRPFPPDAPLAAPPNTRVAVPRTLPGLSAEWAELFRAACARLDVEIVEIDIEPFLAAARLLYDGALVAERHEAVGAFVDTHRGDTALDPTVAGIISAAGTVSATGLLADRVRLTELTSHAMAGLHGCHALLVPTTTGHPTLAEVAADPVTVNSRLGTYTNFCNLMDLCAVAVPAGTDSAGAQFGVSVIARAGADALATDIARMLTGCPAGAEPWPVHAGLDTTRLLVVGAHLRGQPLAGQLDDRGARWLGPVRTAPHYRLARLHTEPPKPGLVQVAPGTGAAIGGELWLIGTAMLGDFLAALPAPMTLGRVELSDGSEVVGFGCSRQAGEDGADITHHGDWAGYLRRVTPGPAAERSDIIHRCWRRTAIVLPDSVIDTSTEVEWLQTGELYVDLRTPADMPAITGRSLDTLTRADLAALCTQQAFAGRLTVEDGDWTWHRDLDLHPASALPDRGRLTLAGDLLIETGVGRDYHEDWTSATAAEAEVLELRLHDDGGGRHGMLLRVGDRFGYARSRGVDPVPSLGLAEAVAAAPVERARELIDMEVSLGVIDETGWRITRSTLPFRVGDNLDPDIGTDEVSTADRDRSGATVRQRWTVSTLHHALALQD